MILINSESLSVKFTTAISTNNICYNVESNSRNLGGELSAPDNPVKVLTPTNDLERIEKIFIANNDAVHHEVQISKIVNGKEVLLICEMLAPRKTIQYTRANGFTKCCESENDGPITESFTVDLVAGTPRNVSPTLFSSIANVEVFDENNRRITGTVIIDINLSPSYAAITSNQNLSNVRVVILGE